MSPIALMFQSLSSCTFFATRPFLTAFGIAFIARMGFFAAMQPATFGPGVDQHVVAALSLFNVAPDSFLITQGMLFILLALAVGEFSATTNTDFGWHEPYEDFASLFRSGSAFLITFGLLDGQSTELIQLIGKITPPQLLLIIPPLSGSIHPTGPVDLVEVARAAGILGWLGHAVALIWSLVTAGVSWGIGILRSTIVSVVHELDGDNSLGLLSILNWSENLWVVTGLIFLVILPIVALLLFFATIGTLFLVRIWFEHHEQQALISCTRCATRHHPSALFCPVCKLPQHTPRQIGLFGQAKTSIATNLTAHRLQLIGRKRCPVCATRLKERSAQQSCTACGTVTFGSIAEVNTYLRALDKQLPRTAIICFALGFIPLLGLVPGVVYYRLSLIASLRTYIPQGVGCATKWGVRLINFVLIALQPIPILGAITLPLMCLVNYSVYRKVLEHTATSKVGRTFAPATAMASVSDPSGTALLVSGPAQAPVHAHVEQPPSAPPAVACSSCGTTVTHTSRFCMQCGAQMQV